MFSSERSYPVLGGPRLQGQQRFNATGMLELIIELFPSCASETGTMMGGRTDKCPTNDPPLMRVKKWHI